MHNFSISMGNIIEDIEVPISDLQVELLVVHDSEFKEANLNAHYVNKGSLKTYVQVKKIRQ